MSQLGECSCRCHQVTYDGILIHKLLIEACPDCGSETYRGDRGRDPDGRLVTVRGDARTEQRRLDARRAAMGDGDGDE